jgi:catalase
MLNAFKFISPEGKEQYVRYSVKPVAGNHHLSDAEAKEKGDTYIFDELKERISKGPIKFEMYAQLAEEGDPTNDITKEWPEERKQVLLGTVEADKLVEENEKEQKHVIFDPMPRVEGIEASDDPIIDFRAALYLISGRERRKA